MISENRYGVRTEVRSHLPIKSNLVYADCFPLKGEGLSRKQLAKTSEISLSSARNFLRSHQIGTKSNTLIKPCGSHQERIIKMINRMVSQKKKLEQEGVKVPSVIIASEDPANLLNAACTSFEMLRENMTFIGELTIIQFHAPLLTSIKDSVTGIRVFTFPGEANQGEVMRQLGGLSLK